MSGYCRLKTRSHYQIQVMCKSTLVNCMLIILLNQNLELLKRSLIKRNNSKHFESIVLKLYTDNFMQKFKPSINMLEVL